MLGHIEDKRRKLPLLEKSLLNALCAAFDPRDLRSKAPVTDVRWGHEQNVQSSQLMARSQRPTKSEVVRFGLPSRHQAARQPLSERKATSLEWASRFWL